MTACGGGEFFWLSAYFGGLLLAARLLPPWVSLVACFLAMFTNLLTIVVPANPDVSFVLGDRRGERAWRCIPWGQWVICEFSMLTLGTMDVILLACGSSVLSDAPTAQDIMPVTTVFGLVLAWLAPGAMWALVVQALLAGCAIRPARADPACISPARPCAASQGHREFLPTARLERAVRARPRAVRWMCRLSWRTMCFPKPESRWPLRIDADALLNPRMLERLARRDEIQKRRRLVGGWNGCSRLPPAIPSSAAAASGSPRITGSSPA